MKFAVQFRLPNGETSCAGISGIEAVNSTLQRMLTNLDIYRSANILVKKHGLDVPPQERRRGC